MAVVASPASRGAFPIIAILCLGLILFAIAATIVLALIPIYLKTRNATPGTLNAAGGHNSASNLAAVLSKNVVTTPASVPAGKRRRRRQVHDGLPPPIVTYQR